jgi:alginate O-acetyltransferase complex protein AlgI
MSYTLDIYFRNIKANKNYIDYTSYITMFPQLVAGPIVRYKDIQYQLRNRSHSVKNISTGFKRFTFGLSKKVIVANSIAFYADEIFALNEVYLNTPLAWLGAFCYALQIYFDFSGYSDMAIGLGEIFGFHFPENFNYPYMAKSIQDFWRRWHISLSSWFRDYLYIPLGGSRFGPAKTYRNLFIVFVLCGFWHGASWTFIIWGLYHGFFLVVERALKGSRIKTLPSFMKHTYTVFVFIVGWVIFRAETLEKLKLFLVKMFIPYWENMDLLNRVLSQPKFIFAAIAGVIFSVPTMPMMRKVIAKYVSKHELDWRITLVGKITIYGFFFIICCISLIGDDYNPFIYFRF